MGKKENQLIDAVITGDRSKAQKLIAAGAQLNHAASPMGYTALHWAVDQGHAQLVGDLLAAGASADTQDMDGYTPLMTAIHKSNKACVKLLLPSSDLAQQDRDELDALTMAEGMKFQGPDCATIFKLIESEPDRRRALNEAQALREDLGAPGAPGPKLRV